MPNTLLGFDIGGTKCAVLIGRYEGNTLKVAKKEAIPTNLSVSPESMLSRLMTLVDGLLEGEVPPWKVMIRIGRLRILCLRT